MTKATAMQPAARPAGDGPPTTAISESKGKHRILTELKRLESEARFLEGDLEKLESTEKASVILQGFLLEVERRPDPLLPVTAGPADPSWDEWFEGPRNSRGLRCQIM